MLACGMDLEETTLKIEGKVWKLKRQERESMFKGRWGHQVPYGSESAS